LGFRFAQSFIEEIVTPQFRDRPADDRRNEFAQRERDPSHHFCHCGLSLEADNGRRRKSADRGGESGAQEIPLSEPPTQDDYGGFGGSVEQPVHENDYLSKVDSDAEGWAESERKRELMAVLVEAAHLRSAARAWYRRQGVLDDLPGECELSEKARARARQA
jgi:hypothetical protein